MENSAHQKLALVVKFSPFKTQSPAYSALVTY